MRDLEYDKDKRCWVQLYKDRLKGLW